MLAFRQPSADAPNQRPIAMCISTAKAFSLVLMLEEALQKNRIGFAVPWASHEHADLMHQIAEIVIR